MDVVELDVSFQNRSRLSLNSSERPRCGSGSVFVPSGAALLGLVDIFTQHCTGVGGFEEHAQKIA